MTNWNDTAVLIAQAFALTKVVHVFVGLYFWEFFLNLDYEYSLITGKRKFSRTSLLYLACRWSTLCSVIMQLLGFDQTSGINCEALLIMAFIFSYVTFLSGSCMIVARIYALWEQRTAMLVVSFAVWLGNTIAFVYNISITRARRVSFFCQVDHIENIRITILSSIITDASLLSLMIFGVMRWKQARMSSGIWEIMYTQGLIYVVVITIVEIPPLVLIFLNLNLPMNQMFMVPAMVIQAITAMRMYRGLVDSTVVNSPVVVGTNLKGLSTKSELKFAVRQVPSHPDSEDGSTLGTGNPAHEANYLAPSPQRFMFMTRQDNDQSEAFGTKTV